jgi:Uma2 family endonuclease
MPVTVELPDTFADVLNRLGGVPPERVLLRPHPGTATEADLIAALLVPGRRRLCELIDGVLVEKKQMSFKEGVLAGYILHKIHGYLEENDLGIVAPGDSQIRFRLGLIRIPDVSFVPWSRMPGEQVPDEAVASVIPTLTVEVRSRGNTDAEIDRKLAEYFGCGVKLAWVIDPREETAKVYTSAARFRELAADGVLEGGRVLPGFKLPLADLFATTRPRKKKPR